MISLFDEHRLRDDSDDNQRDLHHDQAKRLCIQQRHSLSLPLFLNQFGRDLFRSLISNESSLQILQNNWLKSNTAPILKNDSLVKSSDPDFEEYL